MKGRNDGRCKEEGGGRPAEELADIVDRVVSIRQASYPWWRTMMLRRDVLCTIESEAI